MGFDQRNRRRVHFEDDDIFGGDEEGQGDYRVRQSTPHVCHSVLDPPDPDWASFWRPGPSRPQGPGSNDPPVDERRGPASRRKCSLVGSALLLLCLLLGQASLGWIFTKTPSLVMCFSVALAVGVCAAMRYAWKRLIGKHTVEQSSSHEHPELSSEALEALNAMFMELSTSGSEISMTDAVIYFMRCNSGSINAKAMFSEVDQEQNGVITKEEWFKFWRRVCNGGYSNDVILEEVVGMKAGQPWDDWLDARTTSSQSAPWYMKVSSLRSA